jgi:hypothetical protein
MTDKIVNAISESCQELALQVLEVYEGKNLISGYMVSLRIFVQLAHSLGMSEHGCKEAVVKAWEIYTKLEEKEE